mgnify:CR=1 FL=1
MKENIIIKKIEREILKIFDFKNIMDTELVQKKLNSIRQLEKDLPQNTSDKVEFFLEMYVQPLTSNTYYDFIVSNFCNLQKDGLHKANSEFSFDMRCLLSHSHCCFLQSRFK